MVKPRSNAEFGGKYSVYSRAAAATLTCCVCTVPAVRLEIATRLEYAPDGSAAASVVFKVRFNVSCPPAASVPFFGLA